MDDGVGAAVIAAVILLIAGAIFSLGESVGKSNILHECKSFQSTVIRGEKFKCESVKN